ncbi:MAG: 5-formyltetrahydrofolate cyclo-ligase [Muribaculaceae bacterium]|nr:5-formyltetrahydrofolate cyclo-ligase [Muribaculaceae bacterium]MDE6331341.1 5-formyltetrahydrofolate cyclo-ligase [Muribaculaceae bacterium]
MDKQRIRTQMKARKALLDEPEKALAADRAFNLMEQTAAFMLSEHILLYHSLPDELSTREFINRWAGRKHFYLPRVNGVNLEILPYEQSRLHLGAFNIEEPDGDTPLPDLDIIEMVVVPGVAFDRRGNRIGRGKGYYDRLLSNLKALTVGVAYDFQLIDEIDSEEHDVRVNYIITDRHIIACGNRRK